MRKINLSNHGVSVKHMTSVYRETQTLPSQPDTELTVSEPNTVDPYTNTITFMRYERAYDCDWTFWIKPGR